ncbi:MAG: hypothetical protein QOH51_3068 [Acidobacteriota bacterium]|jgi:hypothetical protein|nr:hypothetical protein [Acidobacteriota bacterium]
MVQMLTAYSEGRANANDVMRSLVSHRGWLVPALLVAQSGEQGRVLDNMTLFGAETRLPPGELWIFTDREAAELAQAAGALLGAYASGIAGTELFRGINPSTPTVRVNPYSPRERTWIFSEGSASEVGKIWADAIALEESFEQWRQTGQPDRMAVSNYRAFLLFNHSSGPVVTLPNQGGMSNPAVAFTAPDCAEMFLSKLSEEQRAEMQQAVAGGEVLIERAPQLGIDGLLFNPFGPGASYALSFKSLRPEQAKPSRILMVLLSDGLRLPSGFVAESAYRCLAYCKVPGDWLEGDTPESDELWLKGSSLRPDKLEGLFEGMYGKTWRSGNSDGSQYVVEVGGTRLLNPLHESERPWEQDDPNDKRFRYFYFAAERDGHFKPVSPTEL